MHAWKKRDALRIFGTNGTKRQMVVFLRPFNGVSIKGKVVDFILSRIQVLALLKHSRLLVVVETCTVIETLQHVFMLDF